MSRPPCHGPTSARPSPSAGSSRLEPVPPTSVVAVSRWRRQVVGLENDVAAGVEDLDRVMIEPLVKVPLGPVPDGDRVDRKLVAKVDLPPGVRGRFPSV